MAVHYIPPVQYTPAPTAVHCSAEQIIGTNARLQRHVYSASMKDFVRADSAVPFKIKMQYTPADITLNGDLKRLGAKIMVDSQKGTTAYVMPDEQLTIDVSPSYKTVQGNRVWSFAPDDEQHVSLEAKVAPSEVEKIFAAHSLGEIAIKSASNAYVSRIIPGYHEQEDEELLDVSYGSDLRYVFEHELEKADRMLAQDDVLKNRSPILKQKAEKAA